MGPVLRRRLRWLAPALAGIACAIFVSVLGHSPSQAAQTPLSISIVGNHFVNGAGQTIRLLGANVSSSEYACVDNYGYADDYYAAEPAANNTAAAIAAWGANVVRIPLNEDCWLNTNLPAGDPYGGTNYQQAMENFVSDLNAHGVYAILDLHWTAPGKQTALEQQPMPDMDHSPAFWTSVATAFKANPAVVFDLFNEPFDPTDGRSGDDKNGSDAITWGCWETGTKPDPIGGNAPPIPCSTQAYDENNNPTTKYQIAGMQTLLNAVRATGATQPVITGGLNFADDLTQWADNAPDDPLNQEAASFHNYQGPQKCDNVDCWNAQIAPLLNNADPAHGVPVVTGEFAEDNYTAAGCNATPGSDTFDDSYMNWADTNGVSYVSWVWLVDDPPQPGDDPCSRHGLLSSYDGTPVAPNGTAVHDHLAALAATTTTTSRTTTTTTKSSTTTTGATTTTTGTTTSGSGSTKPPVTLRTFSASVASGGATVGFRLSSPQNCTGTLTGQTVSTYAVTTAKRKRHKVSLGSVHFSLKAGKAKTVVLKLSTASKKLLAHKHSLKVSITITLASAQNRRTVAHRTVTLKQPAKRRRRH